MEEEPSMLRVSNFLPDTLFLKFNSSYLTLFVVIFYFVFLFLQKDVEPYYKAYRKLAELIYNSKQKVMATLNGYIFLLVQIIF